MNAYNFKHSHVIGKTFTFINLQNNNNINGRKEGSYSINNSNESNIPTKRPNRGVSFSAKGICNRLN